MSDVVLKVENLSKIYRLGEVGTGTISHDLNRWWANVRGKEDPFAKVGTTNDRTQLATKGEYVKVLNDINFEVKKGEVLGIIGKNGAGKSTLLKVISQITSPSSGSIKAKGRIASLLEVGTGMHPEMTGKENVYLNGTILGMTRKEIDGKYEEIMDFAGCAKYADTPVKRYSSGMKVRLGFAVAAFLEPEILIVDEVLAVGDAEFQKKAIGKMKDVSSGNGRTVLFVSHNMASIQVLCKRALILTNGRLDLIGTTSQVIDKYLDKIDRQIEGSNLINRTERRGTGLIKVTRIEILNSRGKSTKTCRTGDKIEFKLDFVSRQNFNNAFFRLQVFDKYENLLFTCNNGHTSNTNLEVMEGNGSIICKISKLPLFEGEYLLSTMVMADDEIIDEMDNVFIFRVEQGDFFGTGKVPFIKRGLLVAHEWKT